MKAEEPSLPYYLSIAGGRIFGFIPFPSVLVLCQMQSVRSRIWTRGAVSISCDDNHYTTGTCWWWWWWFIYTFLFIPFDFFFFFFFCLKFSLFISFILEFFIVCSSFYFFVFNFPLLFIFFHFLHFCLFFIHFTFFQHFFFLVTCSLHFYFIHIYNWQSWIAQLTLRIYENHFFRS